MCWKQSGNQGGNRKRAFTLTELQAFYDISHFRNFQKGHIGAQVSSWIQQVGMTMALAGTITLSYGKWRRFTCHFWSGRKGCDKQIWTPTPTEDTLDFILMIIRNLHFRSRSSDLFSGNHYPFVMPLCGNQLGGYYCYLPIPFEKSCKIVSGAPGSSFTRSSTVCTKRIQML